MTTELRPGPDEEPPKKKETLNAIDVIAASAAAATATLIGGQLGVAGTVIGAALGSVITTLALVSYKNAFHGARRKSAHLVQTAVAKVRRPGDETETTPAPEGEPRRAADPESKPLFGLTKRKWQWIIIGAIVSTLLGFTVILGVEKLSGRAFTPGTSQIQRQIEPQFPGPEAAPTKTAQPKSTGTATPSPTPPVTPTPTTELTPSPTATAAPTVSQTPKA